MPHLLHCIKYELLFYWNQIRNYSFVHFIIASSGIIHTDDGFLSRGDWECDVCACLSTSIFLKNSFGQRWHLNICPKCILLWTLQQPLLKKALSQNSHLYFLSRLLSWIFIWSVKIPLLYVFSPHIWQTKLRWRSSLCVSSCCFKAEPLCRILAKKSKNFGALLYYIKTLVWAYGKRSTNRASFSVCLWCLTLL